jgi:hypothetical protein
MGSSVSSVVGKTSALGLTAPLKLADAVGVDSAGRLASKIEKPFIEALEPFEAVGKDILGLGGEEGGGGALGDASIPDPGSTTIEKREEEISKKTGRRATVLTSRTNSASNSAAAFPFVVR